ncbi:MAG TPA: protein kinase [Phycisphaerae bacterium]|nr:protein kinase [Phycisphaerae bacterium]
MWRKDHGSSEADGGRGARITAIIEDVIRRRSTGENVGDEIVLREHPDLVPELEERLRLLRSIQSAARLARRGGSESSDATLPLQVFEESRRFLQEALSGYEVFEELNYGGQGVVYKAFQIAAKRTVAIKVLLDGPLATSRQRHRFEREVELISRLRHPNVVTVYDSGLIRGRHYCVMEYVEGLTIDDYVLVEDLTVRDVVRLFVKVCRAVSYAHQRGVIHRDLNPANILVDQEGEPHVLDFGLAKDVWASGRERGSVVTAEGLCVGTLPYLSPEQAGGLDGQVDVRSDIYSLGVTLFRLLTGVFPYPVQDGSAKVREHIISAEPLRLRRAVALPEAESRREARAADQDLETILTKVLSKEKDHRYQSAAEFADDLERYLAGDAVQARVDSRFYILRRTLRKHRGAVAVALLFLAVLLASTVAVTMLWTQARFQRENAREVARVAHSAMGSVVSQIEEAIRPLAGGVQVRNELLQGVAEKLERLRPLVESDAAMEDLLATLREKQGDIASAQGHTEEAAGHFEAFLAIVERHAQVEGVHGESLIQVARAHRKIANSLKEPVAHYERAIAAGEEFMKRRPESQEGQYELCCDQIAFGGYLFFHDRFRSAIEHLAPALAIAEPIAKRGDADTRWSEALATAQTLNGQAQSEIGNGIAAIASLESALAIRDRMCQERPADAELRNQLMNSCRRLGLAYYEAGRREEGVQLLNRAVELGEYLVRVDPASATWKVDLLGAYDYLARKMLLSKDAEGARPNCEAAVRLGEALAAADSGNLEWQRHLASALALRGRLRLLDKDPGGAFGDLSQALAIRELLASSQPDWRGAIEETGEVLSFMGNCYAAMGEFEQALQSYQRALELRRKSVERDPGTFGAQFNVIVSLNTLATWHMNRRTPADDVAALDWLAQAETALASLRGAGLFAGHEGMDEEFKNAIRQNRAIIAGRAERHACAEEEPSNWSPESSSAHEP